MNRIIKIPLIIKAGEYNPNHKIYYTEEGFNKAVNSRRIKELIKLKKFYLYDEMTGSYYIKNRSLPPNENIIAHIVQINEDSIDIEVNNNYNKSRLKDCKAGMIYIVNKRHGEVIEDLKIIAFELINMPTFNKMKEERDKHESK